MSHKIPFNPFQMAGLPNGDVSSTYKTLEKATPAPGVSEIQMALHGQSVFFLNKSGASIAVNTSLIPDISSGAILTIYAAATTTSGTALTLTDDLSAEEGLFRLIFTNSVAVWDVANIVVIGKDYRGNAITETIAVTADAGCVVVSDNLFSEITSITPGAISASNATAKLAVTAKAVNALCNPAATDDLLTVVGICRGSVDGLDDLAVPDEGYGFFTPCGLIVPCLTEKATQTAGAIQATSNSSAGTLGVQTSGKSGGVGILLDANGANSAAARKLWTMLVSGRTNL